MKRSSVLQLLCSWAVMLALSSVPVDAQSVRGSMRGHVQDQSGAVVPGVSVTIRNTATGDNFSALSDERGAYAFPSINLGTYTLTTEVVGFKKAEVQGIVVEVGVPAIVDVTLEVGGSSEQVLVTAETLSSVNTVSSTLTNVINTRQVADLPLPTRNPVDLARLQIGVAVTGTDTRNASVGGLRGAATNVTQDGINAMDNFVKTSSFFAISAPSLASTEEFSVTVGTVGSDSGRGLAQVRMVTKSGTNELRGSVFWQHRNDNLNANSFFSNSSGTPRPPELQNWGGFAVGGPVWLPRLYDGRNRSFWFFSYEAFRENFAALRNRTVLTEPARKGIFRYTGADGQLQSVNLLEIGNAKAINPVTSAQLNAMPLPNNTEVGDGLNTAGYRFNVLGTDPSDKYVGRFDQELLQSQKWGYHKLEFVYNRAEFLLKPDTFNGIEAPFAGGANAYQSSVRTLMATAIHSTFGSRVTNEARFGHQRAPVGFLRDSAPKNPFFINLGSVTDYDNTFMSQGRNTLVYQFLDNLAVIRGTHTLRMGMDFQSISALTFNDAGIQPTINLGTNSANPDGIVNSSFPSLPAGATGTAIANRARSIFADITGFLGTATQTFNVASPTSGFVSGATRQRNFKQRMLALYLQDEWRLRRNMTFNYGLRWEWQGVPYESQGLAIQPKNGVAGLWGISGPGNLFSPGSLKGTAPTYLDFVNGDTGIKLYNNDWNNFAPFVGVAYQPLFGSGPLRRLFGSQGQSSIRAGFAVSYLQDGFTVVSNALGVGTTNPGLIQSSANNVPTGVLTSSGVPVPVPVFKMPVADADNMLLNFNNGLWTFDPNLRVPYVQQWSFGIEREVARGWVLEARYVGNHAIKVFRAVNYNEVNIFENGFLDEFKNAKKNLDINIANAKGSTFANNNLPGQVALPIFSTLLTGLSASSGFSNSTFVNNLNLGNVGATASTLAFSSTYRTNRANLAPNFFVVNPNAAFARVLTNSSFSNYNSLQVELRKRMSHGLYLQAGYTFSKALTDSEGSQSNLEDFRTLRDLRLDRHRASFDQTHRFISNFIYELPIGTGRRWLSSGITPLRKMIEGWQIGGIINWQTGGPVSIYSNRSTFNAANPGLNPAQLTGASFEQIRSAMGVYKTEQGVFFIDPNLLNVTVSPTTGKLTGATLKEGLLGAPAPGTFGNMPRNNITGPPFSQFDFSITKRTYYAERRNIELKVNFLNAFNHPNFAFTSVIFDDANFARISATRGGARIITFILSLNF
ncbi:MAG: TonB-dependent receptor [Acidobacteria bacterium]|nr:TonB-dependent receptor [Acidobacteriota bacterium]